jgi:hypothetical protein
LFFVDNVTDKKDGDGTMVSGYMPRGYNCGFIYDGGSEHTIAHELGHGIAGLEHVFENSSSSGKTKNLMDYASGEELWHFQWDAIQDPSRVWMKWNKDEEEGELAGPIDDLRVFILWSSLSYAERISIEQKDLLLNSGYKKIYEKHTECGELQKGYASESHEDSFDEIFKMLDQEFQKDGFVLDKFDFYKQLTEEQVLRIYKTGVLNIVDPIIELNSLAARFYKIYKIYDSKTLPYFGSNTFLSKEVEDSVYSRFELKTKTAKPLIFTETSTLSRKLHNHLRFQKDYYIENFVKYIYNNLDNKNGLDKILNNNIHPNFSFISPYDDLRNVDKFVDSFSYDYYGLFGGTQRVLCDLAIYQSGTYYLADIKLTIVDWYGSDIEDICISIKSHAACLNAFFFLQHHWGYSPFRTEVIFHDYVLFTKK